MAIAKRLHPRKLLLGLGVLALIPNLSAATLTWSGGAGADLSWSAPANWTPAGPPTSADAVIFGDAAIVGDNATLNNTIDSTFTVQGLAYKNNSGNHNTAIANGYSLTISNPTGTGVVFGVGSETAPAAVQSEFASISGQAAIVVNAPAGDFVVRQGSAAASGSSKATLDLSNLDSLTADVAHLWVGVANPPGYVSANRNTGNLFLAKTNQITARVSTAGAPGVDVGKSTSNNGGGSFLVLGVENTINADMFGFGRIKEAGVSMHFNPLFIAEGQARAKFRAANGTDRIVNWTLGDGGTDSGTTTVRGTNDFTGGSVDALIDTMIIARASSAGAGANVHKGILTLEHGIVDVNTIRMALQSAANAKSGDATININGDARVVVNGNIEMGITAGGTGADLNLATINVNGTGSLSAGSIIPASQATAKIAITGGTLKLTSEDSVAGTVEAPIDELSLDGANIELVGGNARIVAGNITVGANPNTIKITGLPVIDSYPKTLKLLQYSSATAGLNFTLAGALPAGFTGSIVNNDAEMSVDLVLTAGPLPAIVMWQGNVNGDWDFTTLNWTKAGEASVYADGDTAIFNDTASSSGTVNLTAALEPGSVTVNNSAKTYTFTGPGSIEGSASLTKNGTGTLILANAGSNDFSGGVNILGGTLQVGNGGTTGNLPIGAIVNDGNLVFNRSDNVAISSAIAGTGSVAVEGTGSVTVSGDNTFSGATTVASGRLVINGSLATSGINVAAGAILNGSATLAAPALISGTIDPGNGVTTATLTTGPLTFNAGAKLKFDLSGDPGSNNDQLVANGALTASDNEITVNFLGTPALDVPYTLITYTGAKVGDFATTVKGTHYTATLNQTAAGTVTVTFSGSAASLKWNSTTSNVLDSTTANWLRVGGSADVFFAGDAILFDDSVADVETNLLIPSDVVLVPGSITVDGALDYTITGPGKISGATGITKNGSGNLALGGTGNDYTGIVNVNAGTLKAGSTTALGAGGDANGGTIIATGATLDVAGFQFNGERITVSGSGEGNVGAIINTGAQQINAVGTVTLTGDVTFGGSGRWDLRGGGATLTTEGNAYNVTKVGANQISFVAATIDPALGDVDIKEGVFAIQTTTASLSSANGGGGFGDPAKTITVRNGATLNVYNLSAATPLFKNIVVEAGGTIWNENSISALGGDITLQGAATFNAGGTSLQLDGVVSGAGGINKTGGSALIVNAASTYTGQTTVNSGSLQLTDNGSVASSAVIEVCAPGNISLVNRADGTLTLGSQTLAGNGTINGNVAAASGSFVAPGFANAYGTLTISGDIALSGSTLISIDGATDTNDVIKANSITLGGTLNLDVTGTFQAGDTFKIIDAASISGNFTSITPNPGAGQTWDTASLLVDGTLKVVGGPAVEPTLGGTTIANGNITFAGTGGAAGTQYRILATSDIALPLANWTVVATGNFDANGNLDASVPLAAEAYRFYVLSVGGN